MAYDEKLAERVRQALAPRRDVVEKRMLDATTVTCRRQRTRTQRTLKLDAPRDFRVRRRTPCRPNEVETLAAR